jgi:hypothetical protein
VDAVAQLAEVVVVVSVAQVDLVGRRLEERVQRLAAVAPEQYLVGREPRRPADCRAKREEDLGKGFFPGRWVVSDCRSQCCPEVTVHPLHLPVPLGVVARSGGDLDPQELAQVFEEATLELPAAVGVYGFWQPIPGEDLLLQHSRSGLRRDVLHGDAFHPLAEGVAAGEDVLGP